MDRETHLRSRRVALDLDDIETDDGDVRDQFGDLGIEIVVGGETVDEETLERIESAAQRSAVSTSSPWHTRVTRPSR